MDTTFWPPQDMLRRGPRHIDVPTPLRSPAALGPALFISRATGAGGSEIAHKVAERIDWDLLDQQIVETLAARYGTPRVVLDAVDETAIGWLGDLLNGWVEGHGFSQLAYVWRLRQLFRAAVRRGRVVIVGRGAGFLVPRGAGLSVRLIAPIDFRVEQVMLRQGLSAAEARRFIERADGEHRAFIERYFRHDVTEPAEHDLVVNVEQLTQADAVELIVEALGRWLKGR